MRTGPLWQICPLDAANTLGCTGQPLRRINKRGNMRKYTIAAAALMAASTLATPALAGNADGRIQVKVLATGVLPDGKITNVESSAVTLGAGTQTKANDNVVPTIAVEYFATPNISVETICCLTQHRVSGTAGSVAGVNVTGVDLVNHVLILPATVTLKYHLNAGPIKPYVGVGPSVFFFIDEKPSAAAKSALGITSTKLDNSFGVALQAGFDAPINNSGLGITVDAKKYFMDTKAHFNVGGTEVLRTKHSLDPWVISGGVYYRF